ncbi:MAG: MGMT family protein [candidate division KSB1 bacterium]|nr:MGMT family protein [candidate division KSB1 bacterium]MDZ7401484.1 MGMT family protein [candidate division KSB1 bacterium]
MYEHIYEVISQILVGRVASYGQVAEIVGELSACNMGYASAALMSNCDVPWHRVINRQGHISLRIDGDESLRQREKLEAKGIQFDIPGRIDLSQYGWAGPQWEWLSSWIALAPLRRPSTLARAAEATSSLESTRSTRSVQWHRPRLLPTSRSGLRL